MKAPVHTPSFAPLTAALLYLVVFLCSAVAAYLFYGLLQSAGILKVKGVELAGAVVGFVVIFQLSQRMVRAIMAQLSSTEVAAQLSEKDSKIRELTREVTSLRAGEFPPVTCPEGFLVKVSRDSGIAYAFPATWEQSPETIVGLHMRPLTPQVVDAGWRGNITVTVTPLPPSVIEDLTASTAETADRRTQLLKEPFLNAVDLCGSKDAVFESTFILNRHAVRVRATYPRRGRPQCTNILEGATVLDHSGRRLVIVALHEAQEFAAEATENFQRLLSTIVFLS